jgi:tetratricopeptide (TPR) repeat protein
MDGASKMSQGSILNQEEDSEGLIKKALEIQKRILGPMHPDTLSSRKNLANLLTQQGKKEEAGALYTEAIEIQQMVLEVRKRVLGREHLYTLRSMNNLANLLEERDELEKAKQLCMEALEIQERVLGPVHFDTLASMYNLAKIYTRCNNDSDAKSLCKDALEIGQSVLDVQLKALRYRKQTSSTKFNQLNMLADTVTRMIDSAKAEPGELVLYMEALKMLMWQGKRNEAEPLSGWEAIEIRGDQHPDTLKPLASQLSDTLTSMSKLGDKLMDQSDLTEAEALYTEALEIRHRKLGPEHPDTLTIMEKMANLLFHKGEFVVAEALYKEVLDIRQRVSGIKNVSDKDEKGR